MSVYSGLLWFLQALPPTPRSGLVLALESVRATTVRRRSALMATTTITRMVARLMGITAPTISLTAFLLAQARGSMVSVVAPSSARASGLSGATLIAASGTAKGSATFVAVLHSAGAPSSEEVTNSAAAPSSAAALSFVVALNSAATSPAAVAASVAAFPVVGGVANLWGSVLASLFAKRLAFAPAFFSRRCFQIQTVR